MQHIIESSAEIKIGTKRKKEMEAISTTRNKR